MRIILVLKLPSTLLGHDVNDLSLLFARLIVEINLEACKEQIIGVEIEVVLCLLTHCNPQGQADPADVAGLVHSPSNQGELRLYVSHDY